MDAPAPLLNARGLAVARGGRTVLTGVDLALHPDEVVVLIGPNGAGKSTLLAALAGLLAPAAGTVQRLGRVAAALQSAPLARGTAAANVRAALRWGGVAREEREDRAAAALQALGAAELAGRDARTLSGGEARRVHLARVLALDPDVLLLDEPFAGLDPLARADLLHDAARALRRPGRAALVVVHDRAEAWALADRLGVVLDGSLVALAPPAEVLERPPTARVARFVGFDGELVRPDGSALLLRPAHVALDPAGDRAARVARRVPLEDGVRLELETDGGRLVALAGLPGPPAGAEVRVRLTGGVAYGPAPE